MPLTRADLETHNPSLTLLGHIHAPYDGPPIYYPGSPCPIDMSETGLRRFLRWSEQQAKASGLTPAHHQLLLAIRGHQDRAARDERIRWLVSLAGMVHTRAFAEREFPEQTYTWSQWERTKKADGEEAANHEQEKALAAGKILVKDAIADITLQQVLTRANEFDVIATLNLNGDYLSDALAAQVGGIGIAPGGNINYQTGHAIFEATHGTAPKYAGQDKVNPGSVILSGELMFRYLDWNEVADLIIKGIKGAIAARTVTYDFHRLMQGEAQPVTLVKCSEFGQAVIDHMG
ncbi:MAG: hypothetical protein IH988_03880 [Planctomycetes bacterium]|nr:hypothetical protein [Planctomycetota bacterium]